MTLEVAIDFTKFGKPKTKNQATRKKEDELQDQDQGGIQYPQSQLHMESR